MYVLLILLLGVGIRAQYQNQCTCSCCLGQSCQPIIVGTVNVQNCSAEMCLAQCRCEYPQCAANPPHGQLLSQCTTPPVNTYTCQCLCCNTNTALCTPTLVGYTTAYSCQISACSIACINAYPLQCVSNANGQTQGSCLGTVTTTTAMTTISPWLGNLCSCLYCQSGYTCSASTLVGTTSVSQCSSSDCTLACQNRYPSTCSTIYLSQINGVCLSQGSGRTRCKCNCCAGYGCVDYELITNETCSACFARCTQYSPCMNARPVTTTCGVNHAIIMTKFSLSVLIFALIVLVNSLD